MLNQKALLCAACATTAMSGGTALAAQEKGIEEIVVIAHPLSGEGLSQASDVLEGDELDRKRSANIGETLSRQPGVHSAQFGNAVGRPVIHGLGGPRVRIMEDRIDALDLSVTSADHAVAVEPFAAERVEVLKGPSTLLYGTGAIGGVVDVHTGRIPHNVPDRAFSGGIETRFDDNTDGNTTSAKLNGGIGSFAWHLDGTRKDGDDYEIPGFAESARLRALEREGEDEEQGEEARGVLPGSAFDSKAYAGGAAYVFDRGFAGVAMSRLEADYGLPGGHAHEAAEPAGAVEPDGNATLNLEQTRTDFEFGISDPLSGFSSLNVRLGVNDYEHREIEPNGEIATEFSNEAWELRTELVYDSRAWSGALGVQHMQREFSATGEEAFVPPVDTRESGLFWVGERSFTGFDLETGVRIGTVRHDPQSGSDEEFTTYALSAGIVLPLSENWRAGLTADYASRAPVAEELFSNGPHLVTNAFELGDPELDTERAANLAATIEYSGERWESSLTAYVTQFSDFIYEQATGDEADGLPIFQYQQEDARFVGVDAELSAELARWEAGTFGVRVMADVVEAELDVRGNDNVPRIPPLRYGVGFELTQGSLTASLDYMRVNQQDDVADLELISDAYDDLSAYAGAAIPFGDNTLSVFVVGKNLTDDEQRRHTSFIKDVAPAPGRTIEAGVRLLF